MSHSSSQMNCVNCYVKTSLCNPQRNRKRYLLMKSCAFTAIGHTAEYIQTAVKAGNFYLQFGSKQKKQMIQIMKKQFTKFMNTDNSITHYVHIKSSD